MTCPNNWFPFWKVISLERLLLPLACKPEPLGRGGGVGVMEALLMTEQSQAGKL